MRRYLLKNSLAVLVGGGIFIAVSLIWFSNRTPISVFDGNELLANSEADKLIAKGAYVARLSDCVACHSTPSGAPFAGGLRMMTPLGPIYSTNITPDQSTGIGRYSLADFDRAIRHGIAKSGRRLYPAMPYPSYAKMSDADVRALYAYFTRAVVPVRKSNGKSEIPWPLNTRWPLSIWNAAFLDNQTYLPKRIANSDIALWNRGAYLVQGASHCGSCHTPRSLTMNEKSLDERGSDYLSGAVIDDWYAPSLRGDASTRFKEWTEDDIFRFLKFGRNVHSVAFGPMTDVINNSTQSFSDYDLNAIAHYLKSLNGNTDSNSLAWKYDPKTNESLSLSKRVHVPGAQTFIARCSACHGVDGRGQGELIPRLAGATSMMVKNSDSAINITLNGSKRLFAGNQPDAYRMPSFRNQLSDQEIADVLTFVRGAWGNDSARVTADDVGALRSRTAPASSSIDVLRVQ
jgi:alcohol dehydrogenase (quinone), cytochrome c subunit